MVAITAPVIQKGLAPPRAWREDFVAFANRALLGAAAGGAAGMLIGGAGGRLAMLLLRLTSPDYITGVESDDGFEMGVISLATFNLIAITGVLGAVAGLFVVLSLRFLHATWVPWAWAVPGATLGGSLLIHGDGVDFNLLSPLWLAVALFIAIPAAGLAVTALFIQWWERWWWKDRPRTAIAAAAAWPIVLFFPIGLAILAAAAAWALIARHEASRLLADSAFAQRAAQLAFAAVSLLFLPILVNDILDVL